MVGETKSVESHVTIISNSWVVPSLSQSSATTVEIMKAPLEPQSDAQIELSEFVICQTDSDTEDVSPPACNALHCPSISTSKRRTTNSMIAAATTTMRLMGIFKKHDD